MYFSKFPLTVYDIKGNKNYKLLPDIMRRVKLRSGIAAGRFTFDNYDVKNGERPEDIAFKYYGDAEYHWVVLLVNNVSGATTSRDDTHMLEVNSDTDNATSISNRQHEERVQDKNRQIRLLDSRYLSQFVEEFFALIRK